MQDNARKITYGAMMIALFAILLAVSLYTPLLGNVTMFFIPLPIILYRLKYDRTSSLLILAAGIVLSLLIGGILLVPFAFVHGILGFVIGETSHDGQIKIIYLHGFWTHSSYHGDGRLCWGCLFLWIQYD